MVTGGSQTRRAIAAAAVLAAIAWGAYNWWPSEERRIRRRFDALAETVRETPRDSLAVVAHSVRLASFFDPDVEYQFRPSAPPRQGREQLVAFATMDPHETRSIKVAFEDVSVTVNGATASSRLTVTVQWEDAGGETNIEAREAIVDWRKTDAWRITRIVVVSPMEKPY